MSENKHSEDTPLVPHKPEDIKDEILIDLAPETREPFNLHPPPRKIEDIISKDQSKNTANDKTSLNNQSTQLLCMLVRGLNFIMHDNRIFVFKHSNTTDIKESSSPEQNVLMNILTTQKFRAISALYYLFRILDSFFLLLVIALTFINHKITTPTPRDTALIATIGMDVFYSVMMFTNKYWILQRLSCYIGLAMYVVYFGLITFKQSQGDYAERPQEFTEIIMVVTIRFFAFSFEELVDVAVEGEVHNHLLLLTNYNNQHSSTIERQDISEKGATTQVLDDNNTQKKCTPFLLWSILCGILLFLSVVLLYLGVFCLIISWYNENSDSTIPELYFPGLKRQDENLGIYFAFSGCFYLIALFIFGTKQFMDTIFPVTPMALSVEYKGSFFAWYPRSVYTWKPTKAKKFSRILFYILMAVPGFFSCMIIVPFAMFIIVMLIVCTVITAPCWLCGIFWKNCPCAVTKECFGNCWKEVTV